MLDRKKVSIGLPYYGGFEGNWVSHMLQFTSVLSLTHDIVEVIAVGNMTADHNRNTIVHEFLKSKAEWLFWIDSDTIVPAGAVDRMLSHGRTLVSGLYYGKHEPHNTIAYTVYNGGFAPISEHVRWERGEIIEVDAVGMGCMLTHRSVFDDILKHFQVLQIPGGGVVVAHNSDIMGNVETTSGPYKDDTDGKVYKGQLRQRLTKPTLKDLRFPFFMVEHIRTEDMFFFDLAKRVGHKPVLDTSVECTHMRFHGYGGADFRDEHGH